MWKRKNAFLLLDYQYQFIDNSDDISWWSSYTLAGTVLRDLHGSRAAWLTRVLS